MLNKTIIIIIIIIKENIHFYYVFFSTYFGLTFICKANKGEVFLSTVKTGRETCQLFHLN